MRASAFYLGGKGFGAVDLSNKYRTMLILQLDETSTSPCFDDALFTRTALACLNEATQKQFAFILIQLPAQPVSARDGIFSLCQCLKTNPRTRETPVLVWLEAIHREIIMEMHRIKVRYIKVSPFSQPIASESLIHVMKRKNASVRTDCILDKLCPFLHYSSIEGGCEMISCLAYGDRMMLGGERLHEICETSDHLYCKYFMNPKPSL